jgi:predicted PolB exonuclease-like 3'-5' exonuclease
MNRVIVWDVETVPDIKGFAAANGHEGKGDDEISAAMATNSPSASTCPFRKFHPA